MLKREARKEDLNILLELYTHLNADPKQEATKEADDIWNEILADKNHHVLFVEVEGKIVASCVVLIVRNLTHGLRPYAVVENVVTHADYRKKGYGRIVLDFAKEIAVSENCYKIMLSTGRKDEGTLLFYEKAGYNRKDKTAFIQWL